MDRFADLRADDLGAERAAAPDAASVADPFAAVPFAADADAADADAPAAEAAEPGGPRTDVPRPVARGAGDLRLATAVLVVLAATFAWRLASACNRRDRGEPPRVAVAPWRVDLGTASVAELGALPGVGPSIAARIDAERRRAPIRSPEDLRRVPGIGPALAARIAPHAVFAQPPPHEVR